MEFLELAGHRLCALSVGGLETCIDLPGYKVAFDIGRSPAEIVSRETVLFTHAHMDHMGGVAYHAATRALRGMKPPTYVLAPGEVEAFENLFDAWRRLDRSDMEHVTVPLAPGEEHRLRNGLSAIPFRSPHAAPCQGYALWQERRKLLPQFQDLPQDELRRLRVEEGAEITETLRTAEVAFPGDTLIDVLEREEVCRRARLLILECTFVDDAVTVGEARSMGHVHLDEIAERAALFENEAILLTHFSARYRAREILDALDAKLPAGLRERVTPLLGAH